MADTTPQPPCRAAEGRAPSGFRPPVRALLKGLALIAFLVGAVVAFKALGLSHALEESWVDDHIRGRGPAGWGLFVGITFLASGLGLPRQIPAFLGGYAFGAIGGTLLSLVGTGLGCAASFLYSRFLARNFVRSRFKGRIQRVDAFLRSNPFAMTVIIRLLPIGSNIGTNLLAGVSSVRFWPFVLGSVVGYVPQNYIFSLLGSGVNVDPTWRITVGVVLFVLASWWGWSVYRRYRAGGLSDDDETTSC